MATVILIWSTLVCLLLNKQSVHGLQCYRCTYNKITTGSSILDKTLELVTSKITSDPSCLLEKDEDIYSIESGTCPPAVDGTAQRCVVVKGKITFNVNSVLKLSVTYNTLTRDCVDVDDSSAERLVNKKCLPEARDNRAVRTMINDYFEGLDVSSFDGEGCYYKYSLGSELFPTGIVDTTLGSMLQCYSCSANTIKTGQDIVDKVINWVAKIATDKYCSLTEESDKYNIISKTCAPPVSSDEIKRCVVVKGDITFIVAGISVVYKSLTRDCVDVGKTSEKAAYNDRCYAEQTESSTFKTIVNDYFEGLQVGDFQGNGCYFRNSLASSEDPDGSMLVTTAGQGRLTWAISATIILITPWIL